MVRSVKKAAKPKPGKEVSSLLPLHHKIYIALRQRLLEGALPADQPLPGEHRLAAEFKVSRVTVRRTLARLDEEGLVDRRHGVGTFPRVQAKRPAGPESKESYYEDLRSAMGRYRHQLLEYGYVPTPFACAATERFGPMALKIVRLSFLKRTCVHLLRSYVPADIGQKFSRAEIGNSAMIEELARHGAQAAYFRLDVGAIAADSADAHHLDVAVGTPLVSATRRAYDAENRLIEYNETLSRADQFAYRFGIDVATGLVRLGEK